MMRENRGQVSLEYLLIFSVSLIIIIAFTMPLLEQSMDATFDVSDSINVKSELSHLAQAIREVYGQGQGSKQTLTLDMDKSVKINVANNHVSVKMKLKDNKNKEIRIDVKSKLKSDSFKLPKGESTFVVEWPVNEKYMTIYQI